MIFGKISSGKQEKNAHYYKMPHMITKKHEA